MARTAIDPITRIEGHMRVEMEVNAAGIVEDAWVSGGSFRGMELVVKNRTPEDAAQIVQRICGVCPVSHVHSSTIAAEKAYGIQIPNSARIIRNLIEGAQFLHSHILWFYNLAALDYVNPINALKANPIDAFDLAKAAGTSVNSDFAALKERLTKFAENGQLSIFSGNWFDAEGGNAYKLPPELDLICTAHYLEALKMQARSSEIAALLGGKMPHVMTIIPGGTAFVPTAQKLDDLKYMVDEVYDWVASTMIQDTLALAPYYADVLNFGKGCGRYAAWGVFEAESMKMEERYLPAGVLDENLRLSTIPAEEYEQHIAEYVGRSWYKGDGVYPSPDFTVEPDFTEYDVDGRYTWCKAPQFDGKPYECTSLSRILVAYQRKVPFVVKHVDEFLAQVGQALGLGGPAPLAAAQSTLGRTAVRQVETLYVAQLMKDWTAELIEAVKGGDSEYFRDPLTRTGSGAGFWEAPRGALYHSEKVNNGKIEGYQIIIPTTWNLAPINQNGEHGPIEQALIGNPVEDMEKPINPLRTVHSYDPCVSCAVHISQPSTGKRFSTVTNPWGVK
jgi:hydrogenase large subunit